MTTTNLLMTDEKLLPQTEQIIILALRHLHSLNEDGARDLNGVGFNKIDSGFGASIVAQLDAGKRLTPRQIETVSKMLVKYRGQLITAGIMLPDSHKIDVLIKEKNEAYAQKTGKPVLPKHSILDLREHQFYFFVPYSDKAKCDAFREELSVRYSKKEKGFTGYAYYTNNNKKEYYCPATEEIMLLFLSNKYFSNAELTPNAHKMKQKYEERIAKEMQVKVAEDKKHKLAYVKVLKHVGLEGDANPEVAPGIHLREHQRQAVRYIVWKTITAHGCLIADQVGLGKTFEAIVAAKALFMEYGWKIVIATTKSMVIQWMRDLDKFGLASVSEVYSWEKIPEIEEDETWKNFVFIADECHLGKNENTIRSRKMKALALDPRCKSFVPMTGTPLDNSRPREAYPILFACKHPRLYSENPAEVRKMKKWYYSKFCGETTVFIGPKRVMDEDGNVKTISTKSIKKFDGGTNLTLWHKLFVYHYNEKDNDPFTCILARRKKDLKTGDMPECYIYGEEVDVNAKELSVFKKQVLEAWERFQTTVKVGVEKFIQDYRAEHGKEPSKSLIEEKRAFIKNAEKMVMFQAYARSGAFAKLPWTFEKIDDCLEDDDKIVIGTTFKEVAYTIKKYVDEKYGEGTCLIIEGSVNDRKRDAYVQDFQDPNGACKVFIITKAGSAGITLTAACTFISLERAIWTPGLLEQQYGRVNRFGQTRAVSVILAQLAEYITTVDKDIDVIIEKKAVGANTALYNETVGIQYNVDINNKVEEYMEKAVKDLKKVKIA